ncbi:MAG TPA: hypothetical protein V6D05_03655 [Stenomitos sp.]
MANRHARCNQTDPFPWLLLLVGALFLVTFPWLSLFNRHTVLGGVPLLPLYLFGIWGLFIVLSECFRPSG